ncbi:phosphoribosyltransferase [Paenibacillus rhizovicinus]|uniref:Phosphoribosyltransferase n=1 Tax=Paenibacillus rhizovicinus TaxID=2704463 RepID=A0A6C0P3I8_9BACL|nr:phosphoribosyltransferase [Paenibacillus rhizovicinus]QHW32836.1 phosphoribosyltransferase [Paenibacillus rhizovicinus]
MTQAKASEILLKRLIATNGLAVRSNEQDDAFWYTSGKPGPFYINTQNIAGQQEAHEVLSRFNAILQADLPLEKRSKAIYEIVDQAVASDEAYEESIDTLLAHYLAHHNPPTLISGGERRDWFFSIPIAQKLNVPHVFLFKNGDYHVTDHEGNAIQLQLSGQTVLHVADIINQASSYLNRWIPILQSTGVDFQKTLSVAVRNQDGVQKLMEKGISVISPLLVDIPLFKEAHDLGLINDFAHHEIVQFYASPKEWTRQYIADSAEHRSSDNDLDKVKDARLQAFKEADPYRLKAEFPLYFA